jgi:hypothetical protein
MDAPTSDLIRMFPSPSVELRLGDDPGDGRLGTLYGHFAVFDQWTLIDSWWEGKFRERIARGAFKKTIREKRDQIRVLYDHGFDPQLGNKPLGPIEVLKEDDKGGYHETKLIATDYNRDFVVPALEADLLGQSFRFRVIKDEWVEPDPDTATLPERTIKEVELFEFGPVTFPAYTAAEAGIRGRQEFEIWRSLDEQGRQDLVRLIRQASGTPNGAANPAPVEPGRTHSQVSRAEIEQIARRIQSTVKELTTWKS